MRSRGANRWNWKSLAMYLLDNKHREQVLVLWNPYQVTGRQAFSGETILLTNSIVVHHEWEHAGTSKPFFVGNIGPEPIHGDKYKLINNTNTRVGINRQ